MQNKYCEHLTKEIVKKIPSFSEIPKKCNFTHKITEYQK